MTFSFLSNSFIDHTLRTPSFLNLTPHSKYTIFILFYFIIHCVCINNATTVSKTHNMYGFSLTGHLHLGRQHAHDSSHDGIVLSGVWSLILPTFISVKHRFVGWASQCVGYCVNYFIMPVGSEVVDLFVFATLKYMKACVISC